MWTLLATQCGEWRGNHQKSGRSDNLTRKNGAKTNANWEIWIGRKYFLLFIAYSMRAVVHNKLKYGIQNTCINAYAFIWSHTLTVDGFWIENECGGHTLTRASTGHHARKNLNSAVSRENLGTGLDSEDLQKSTQGFPICVGNSETNNVRGLLGTRQAYWRCRAPTEFFSHKCELVVSHCPWCIGPV